MTDIQKMLEMAAKAMGYECDFALHKDFDDVVLYVDLGNIEDRQQWVLWKPDTDDGDNSRMRTKLRIDVQYAKHCVRCLGAYIDRVGKLQFAEVHEQYAAHSNDPDSALRICALRVAATMGAQM